MDCGRSCSCSYKPGLYAAIDIGTVTCRLLIASVDASGHINEILRKATICNLGVGVDSEHRLQDDAIARTVSVLCGYSNAIEQVALHEGADIHVRTIATSASRDAQNAHEFQDQVAELAHLKLEVIPGQEEAALSFKGASSAFPGNRVVVLDIGGGSTEIIAGEGALTPEYAHSFDIGCRRLTDRYLKSDPPTKEELQKAAEFTTQELAPYLDMLRSHGCLSGQVIGVAGTATSAVSMRDAMVVYDPLKVHGSKISRGDVDGLLKRLSGLTHARRKQIVGLEPERASVVVAGLLILQCIMECADLDFITVSESDILQGLILKIAEDAL